MQKQQAAYFIPRSCRGTQRSQVK